MKLRSNYKSRVNGGILLTHIRRLNALRDCALISTRTGEVTVLDDKAPVEKVLCDDTPNPGETVEECVNRLFTALGLEPPYEPLAPVEKRVFWAYVQAPWQNEQSPDVLLEAELNEDEDGHRACEHLSGPPDYSFLLDNSFETPEQAAVEAVEQWNFENATDAVHEDGAVWWVDLWTHEGEHTAVEVTTRVTFVVEPKVTPV